MPPKCTDLYETPLTSRYNKWPQNTQILRVEGDQMAWFKYAYLSCCTTSNVQNNIYKIAMSSIGMQSASLQIWKSSTKVIEPNII